MNEADTEAVVVVEAAAGGLTDGPTVCLPACLSLVLLRGLADRKFH